jgi:hypothetical protein
MLLLLQAYVEYLGSALYELAYVRKFQREGLRWTQEDTETVYLASIIILYGGLLLGGTPKKAENIFP